MTARATILGALVLLSCIGNSAVRAESDKVRIDGPGVYRLLGRAHDGGTLSISIHVSSVPAGWYVRSSVYKAKSLITGLKIDRGKHRLFVGLSAYADLLDPHEVSLEVKPKSTRLVVVGGDASESYRAVMVVGRQLVSSREIYSLGSQPVERTVYWIRELKDE